MKDKTDITKVKQTAGFRRWYLKLLVEKKHYHFFKNTQFDLDLLAEYYLLEKSPIETLNDLITAT